MSQQEYDKNNQKSILEYAERLKNKTLRDVLSEDTINSMEKSKSGNKGRFGQKIEKHYFGYDLNSDTNPDFPCGLELKATPIKINKDGSLSPKERLVCNIINFEDIIDEEWKSSSFLRKNKNMLIIRYIDPRDKDVDQLDYEFIDIQIHNILDNSDDEKQFEADWNIIVNKIKDGKAHELSESDTKYLGACTKGSTAKKSLRKQPNNNELAKQRAFSFKTKYMKKLLVRSDIRQ